ncbi:MAG: hypothetical protein IJS94_05290 [Clostridia bacterium]|nr:hypothetical protein [Clostridia bacterium]
MTADVTGSRGIDVYVGDGNIDWKKVGASGIKFAMIKATQGYLVNDPKSGMITDSKFRSNITGAYENGLYCGAYHYLMAKTTADAKKEAEYFINTIMPYKDKIDLFAGVDMENDKAKKYSTKEKKLNTDILIAFCDALESRGFDSIIYINPNFIKNYLEFDRLKGRNIWLAYWTEYDSVKKYIESFEDPSQFRLWQYGDSSVDGISKKTDGDIALFDLSSHDVPVGSTKIPDGGDLNCYLTPGDYYSRTGNCKNAPDNCKAFILTVKNGASGNRCFTLQILYDIDSGTELKRGLYTKNGSFSGVQKNWR